jgi:predicted phage-related endonuclease
MTRSLVIRPEAEELWLDLRHRYWNASDTASLFGEHPFQTLADVAVRKITRSTNASNRAQSRGKHLEEAVASWWSEEHGVLLKEPPCLYVFDKVVMATLDRVVIGSDTDAVEVKTTSKYVSEPERYWWWQCQAQCLSAGLERVHVAVLDGSMDLKTFVIEADPAAMDLIASSAAKAMEFIRRGEIPPEAELGYRHFEKLHPRPTEASAELDDEAAEAVAELARIRTEKKILDQAEEKTKAVIAAALGDAASGIWEGNEIVSWRSVTRHNLDGTRLRKEQPETYRDYLVEASYRTMRLVDTFSAPSAPSLNSEPAGGAD